MAASVIKEDRAGQIMVPIISSKILSSPFATTHSPNGMEWCRRIVLGILVVNFAVPIRQNLKESADIMNDFFGILRRDLPPGPVPPQTNRFIN